MRKLNLVFALALVSGCGDFTVDKNPDSDREAVDIVWHGVYDVNEAGWDPPPITWDFTSGCLHENPTSCDDGLYYSGRPGYAIVEWEGSYHKSALAHELYHALLFRAEGDADGNHTMPGWKIVVPDAENALKGAGL